MDQRIDELDDPGCGKKKERAPADAAADRVDEQHHGSDGPEQQSGGVQPAREIEPDQVPATVQVAKISKQYADETDDRHRQQHRG